MTGAPRILCLCAVALGCGRGAAITRSADGGGDAMPASGADAAGNPEVSDAPPTADALPPSDVRSPDASEGGVRLCSGQPATMVPGTCRTAADCGPPGPVVCWVGHYDWGPAACPLPPGSQPCPNECAANADCSMRAGGTCDAYTASCPKCNGHICRYPPPPCMPNSCNVGERCRSDGACEPIPCNQGGTCDPTFTCNPTSPKADRRGCAPIPCDSGYTCPVGTRCNLASTRADAYGCEATPCDQGYACPTGSRCRVGSARADTHGCELTPCDDGFTCPENSRCTASPAPVYSHGCTPLTCKSESECDCGYCIGGSCSAAPGTCQYPPV